MLGHVCRPAGPCASTARRAVAAACAQAAGRRRPHPVRSQAAEPLPFTWGRGKKGRKKGVVEATRTQGRRGVRSRGRGGRRRGARHLQIGASKWVAGGGAVIPSPRGCMEQLCASEHPACPSKKKGLEPRGTVVQRLAAENVPHVPRPHGHMGRG